MMAGNGELSVPPGFRFHPTDEELLYYYLTKKVSLEAIDLDVIREVDFNKLEPWDLKINRGLDRVIKMNGISSAIRTRNIQQELEQIEQPQLSFGKQRGGTRPFTSPWPTLTHLGGLACGKRLS